MMKDPDDPGVAGLWCKNERTRRGWSATDLAKRINGIAADAGDPVRVSQQVISKFEQGNTKRKPGWVRYVSMAFIAAEDETGEDPYLSTGTTDAGVLIRLLPTFAGMGAGGTGDGDDGYISMSRDLIERVLRAPAESLRAMVAEGNSMEPDFEGGDQILFDTRRVSLAQPGAFCLWDMDGYVVKYVERVQNSDPPRVRLVSKNSAVYPPVERLVEEIQLVGRVVWFGRTVQ